MAQEKEMVPPPGRPTRSFLVPPPEHLGLWEDAYLERVDTSATTYERLSRGTLYSTVKGADQRIIDAYPDLRLVRESVNPFQEPWADRIWSTDITRTTKTIGQTNLTPEKYRRLIRTIETDTLVDADYDFPNGLTGDQVQVELAQRTIEEARLKIIEEVIAIGSDPLLGAEIEQFGELAIYESVVNEGSDPDTGYPVLKSTITPFGNGKAAKITVKYLTPNSKTVGAHTFDTATVIEEQDYERRLDIVTPQERYIAPQGLLQGEPRLELRALNPYIDEVRTIGINTDVLDDFVYSYFGKTNVDLPDRLINVAGIIEKATSDGADSQTGAASLSGNGGVSLDLPASSQSSASIVPEAIPGLKQFWGNNIDATHFHFLCPSTFTATQVTNKLIGLLTRTCTITIASPGVVTLTAHGFRNGTSVIFSTTGALPTGLVAGTTYYVINAATDTFQVSATSGGAAINTTGTQSGVHSCYPKLNAWPKFNPELVTIVMLGGSASAQAKAVSKGSSSMGDTGSSSSAGGGVGYSQDKRLIVKKLQISPTIHAAINLTGTATDSETVSAHADAEASGLGPFEEQDTGPLTINAYVNYLRPSDGALLTTIPATTGDTTWPTGGKFIKDIVPSIFGYNYIEYHAVVVDAADFPNN